MAEKTMAHSAVLGVSMPILDGLRAKLMSMAIGQSAQQICEYLCLKGTLARTLKRNIEFLTEEIKLQIMAIIHTEQELEQMMEALAAREEELRTTLGEVTLIFCPAVNCPTHTVQKNQNVRTVTEPDAKNNTNEIKAKEKSVFENNTNDNTKIKNNPKKKRNGQEDFKTPNKFARKKIEIPTEKVTCTTNNKFAVLDDVITMEDVSGTPLPPPP
ncbi:uncharacterized protein TNCV_4358901 [Trichonephila clavipes]|nr:uncharacterized protein TNCV_4358901 [Trichonephila clavipes]